MIVHTFSGVQALTEPNPSWSVSSGSISMYGFHQSYAEIYRTQPNVRICVDFLSRNIAQLSWPVYRRISDTDRERLSDHQLGQWLTRPNPSTTRYRLFESLIADLGIYFNAYWLKVRYTGTDGKDAIGLVRLPPEEMRVEGGLLPTRYVWTTANGEERPIALSEVVYFNGYNPLNPLMGLSPLEMLRQILAEESAVTTNRQAFWRNAGRMEGVIQQSKDAPNWTEPQQKQFREQWQEFSHGGARVGQTAVLPKGMEYKEISFSAKDSEYTLGGKLRREVCAAAYHIPQPMIGILDHATFSNIKEQHKHLYQDTLGPWLEMINQAIEGQLLIECEDQNNVYIEANIDAKLAGTPEERAQSLQLSIGRPWRTVNEGRALENLPRIDKPEFDTPAPQQGGPAESGDSSEPSDESTAATVEPIIQAARARQQARLSKLPEADRAVAFFADLGRWNRELADDLTPLVGAEEATRLAHQANTETLRRLEAEAQHV